MRMERSSRPATTRALVRFAQHVRLRALLPFRPFPQQSTHGGPHPSRHGRSAPPARSPLTGAKTMNGCYACNPSLYTRLAWLLPLLLPCPRPTSLPGPILPSPPCPTLPPSRSMSSKDVASVLPLKHTPKTHTRAGPPCPRPGPSSSSPSPSTAAAPPLLPRLSSLPPLAAAGCPCPSTTPSRRPSDAHCLLRDMLGHPFLDDAIKRTTTISFHFCSLTPSPAGPCPSHSCIIPQTLHPPHPGSLSLTPTHSLGPASRCEVRPPTNTLAAAAAALRRGALPAAAPEPPHKLVHHHAGRSKQSTRHLCGAARFLNALQGGLHGWVSVHDARLDEAHDLDGVMLTAVERRCSQHRRCGAEAAGPVPCTTRVGNTRVFIGQWCRDKMHRKVATVK